LKYLITGAASGIGLATARLLRQKGAELILWDTQAEPLAQAASELDAQYAVVDVTQPEQVKDALQGVSSLHGVLHSAGILRTGLFEEIPLQEHCRMVDVNLKGTLIIAYHGLPLLKATRGSLLLMGSGSAFYGPPEFASYGAAKGGVLTLAQALRIEWEPYGIHVGVVSPLFVASPMLDERNSQARLVQKHGKIHTPEQVAQAIVRGMERRQFLIFPNWRPKALYWVSRLLFPFAHGFMRGEWRSYLKSSA
jgi:3-dehydrosphinganine reductase